MPTGAEIVEQLNASMESESSTDNEEETTETEEVAEAKSTQKEETSGTKGSKETGERGSKSSKPDIPYDRFKQKVDQVAELTTKLENLVASSESTTAREQELRERISALEEEADILNRVRELGENPKYRPMLETIDAALKGIDEDVESGAKTEKQGAEEVAKLFGKHREEMNEAFADQRADLLLENARMLSDSILNSLPEGYDDGDKDRIADLLPDLVDWDAIEVDPGIMRDEIVEGYKQALIQYGEPRGALKARIHELETNKSEESEVDPAVADEEFVRGILDDERMSKFKKDSEGNVTEPEMSEAEFNDNFAQVLRRVYRQ